MATISEIAGAADVSVETVLRVLNRDEVSEDVSRRVTAAIEAYGGGPQPTQSDRSDDRLTEAAAGHLPAPQRQSAETDALAPRAVAGEVVEDTRQQQLAQEQRVVEGPHEHLLRAIARVASEAEAESAPLPSSVRYESLEVGPLAERVTVMDRVVERLLENLEGLDDELRRGRTERLEDLTLLVNLITTSWRSVDQRLNRIERKVNRPPEETRNDGVISMEERRRPDREERV